MRDEHEQILTPMTPAPGWRVMACEVYFEDDENMVCDTEMNECPVLGWAAVRQNSQHGPQDDEFQLFIWHEQRAMSVNFAQNFSPHDAEFVVLPPGEELTAEQETELRAKVLASRRKVTEAWATEKVRQ